MRDLFSGLGVATSATTPEAVVFYSEQIVDLCTKQSLHPGQAIQVIVLCLAAKTPTLEVTESGVLLFTMEIGNQPVTLEVRRNVEYPEFYLRSVHACLEHFVATSDRITALQRSESWSGTYSRRHTPSKAFRDALIRPEWRVRALKTFRSVLEHLPAGCIDVASLALWLQSSQGIVYRTLHLMPVLPHDSWQKNQEILNSACDVFAVLPSQRE